MPLNPTPFSHPVSPSRLAQRPIGRRAFSLIEVLVVVGIIAVLVTLAVIGFKVVGGTAKTRVTNNQLENCKGLLNEYELTSTLDTLPSGYSSANTSRWQAAPTGSANNALYCSVIAPKPTTLEERYLRDETARTIARLRAVPKNRESIEKMSADRVVKDIFPGSPDATLSAPDGVYPTAQNPVDGVVLLDGWGNPIYFVPGGGLTGVNRGYKGSGDPNDKNNYSDQLATITSPDHRPFWVSPGPDGNLTTGDDNIYSFGQ